jgi:hypothetical protein
MAIIFISAFKNITRKYRAKKRIRKRGLQGFRVKDPLVFFADLEIASIKYNVIEAEYIMQCVDRIRGYK